MIQSDSIHTVLLEKELPQKESHDSLSRFFTEVGKVEIVEKKRVEYENVSLWMHLSFFFWLVIIIFAKQSYTYRLRQIIWATLKPKQVKLLQREGNLLKQSFPILLLLLFGFVISLFAFLIIHQRKPGSFYFSSGEGFLLLYGLVILYHLLKFAVIKFTGILFETQSISTLYLLDHFLFYITEGIVLFPVLILYVYSGFAMFLYIAVILLVALLLFRLKRAFVLGLDCTNYSLHYLFLYLCTLEVMPIFLLYKLSVQFL